MKRLVFLCAAVGMLMCGCGSGDGAGSNTNGTLSMSDLSVTVQGGGTYLVTGTATYTPPAAKVPNGLQMNIVANLVTKTFTQTVTLDSTGTAQLSFSASQPSVLGVAMIDASVGDLKAHKEAIVPAFP